MLPIITVIIVRGGGVPGSRLGFLRAKSKIYCNLIIGSIYMLLNVKGECLARG